MTADLPAAHDIRRRPDGAVPYDIVVLAYDERLLRRRRLVTVHDEGFLVDLAETVGLDEGDCLVLADGRLIEVIAAEEDLIEVQGDLHRYAWHIGNRHAPCQIERDRLLIRRDHVLRAMLEGLGAVVKDVVEPFTPEGGAYGMGRVMGHSHGTGHGHGHGHAHDHDEENVLAGLGHAG